MSQSLKVVYEDGVLKPLEPVSFREHEQITLIISEDAGELVDPEFQRFYQSRSDESVTLESVRKALSKIPGSVSEDIIAERNER